MKIAVAGTGYVGLSIATLLSQKNDVCALDVIPEKVEAINKRISPIKDEYIEKYFAEKDLNLKATFQEIIERLKDEGVEVIIYEPTLKAETFNGCRVVSDFEEFAEDSDVILANRLDDVLKDVKDKVYTRDLYSRD